MQPDRIATQPTKPHRFFLVVSGLIAAAIGGAILVAPAAFHASNGIELAADPSLMSEVRAPGGALLGLGLLMLAGGFMASLARVSTAVAAAVYLSYGLARLVSVAVDGVPADGLLLAAGAELLIGAIALAFVARPVAGRAEPRRRCGFAPAR